MQPKFTPGPWHPGHFGDDSHPCECKSVVDEGYAGGICTIHVGNGLPIGEGGNDAPPREEAIANMHLIAAGPQMFGILGLLLCVDFERFTEHDETLLESVIEDAKSIRQQILELRVGQET